MFSKPCTKCSAPERQKGQSLCVTCQREYERLWREKNREKINHQYKQWRANMTEGQRERERESGRRGEAKVRQKLLEYRLEHPCIDCGETNPICLHFDHVTGEKRMDITHLRTYGWPSVEKELQKCVVRCGNCHVKRHFLTKGTTKYGPSKHLSKAANARRDVFRRYLQLWGCIDCGLQDVDCLEFDHVFGEKLADVSILIDNDTKTGRLQSTKSLSAK